MTAVADGLVGDTAAAAASLLKFDFTTGSLGPARTAAAQSSSPTLLPEPPPSIIPAFLSCRAARIAARSDSCFALLLTKLLLAALFLIPLPLAPFPTSTTSPSTPPFSFSFSLAASSGCFNGGFHKTKSFFPCGDPSLSTTTTWSTPSNVHACCAGFATVAVVTANVGSLLYTRKHTLRRRRSTNAV